MPGLGIAGMTIITFIDSLFFTVSFELFVHKRVMYNRVMMQEQDFKVTSVTATLTN